MMGSKRTSGDAEDEGLTRAERFAQFEVLVRDAAGDRPFATPIGETAVHGAAEFGNDLGSGFAPILGDFRPAVVPKVRLPNRMDGSGILLVVHDRHQDVAVGVAGQPVQREDAVRCEVLGAVLGIELQAGHRPSSRKGSRARALLPMVAVRMQVSILPLSGWASTVSRSSSGASLRWASVSRT